MAVTETAAVLRALLKASDVQLSGKESYGQLRRLAQINGLSTSESDVSTQVQVTSSTASSLVIGEVTSLAAGSNATATIAQGKLNLGIPVGATGATGLSGPAGANGADGADGLDGAQGPAGATGPTGPAGPTGPQGPAGANGVDGVDGAQGPQGIQGPAGATGPQGPQGIQGPAGADGADGLDGATGPQGPAGPAGPQGPAGANGVDGAIGPAGPQGPAGPAGADGNDIDLSSLTANTQIADADKILIDDAGTNKSATFTEVKEWIRGEGVLVGRDGGVNQLRIRDSRDDVSPTPDDYGGKQVSFDFTDEFQALTASAYWSSVMTMKGWSGSYRVWQLMSSATSEGTDQTAKDTEPLYFRSGEDSGWGVLREVMTYPGQTPNADGAANQILQTDGAGTLSWVDLPAGGGGTPSGVAGAIQFSDGAAFSSDDANLHYDSANNRLGIGTNAPAHTLHCVGTGNFPIRLQHDEGNTRINKYGHIQIQNDNSSPFDGAAIDSPIWQIGQRDAGQLDIAFGAISTQLVAASDAIISMKRDANSATGAKQIGFLGAAPRSAVDDGLGGSLMPLSPTLVQPATPNEMAIAQRLDEILAGLQSLGLFL